MRGFFVASNFCHSEATAEESAFSLPFSAFRIFSPFAFYEKQISYFVRNDIVYVAGTETRHYNQSQRVSCYSIWRYVSAGEQTVMGVLNSIVGSVSRVSLSSHTTDIAAPSMVGGALFGSLSLNDASIDESDGFSGMITATSTRSRLISFSTANRSHSHTSSDAVMRGIESWLG